MSYQENFSDALSQVDTGDSAMFLLHALAVVANSDKYHIDRKYTRAADYAFEALAFVGLDTDDIDLAPAVEHEFRQFRKTRSSDIEKPESLTDALNRAYRDGSVSALQSQPVDQPQDEKPKKDYTVTAFHLALIVLSLAIGWRYGWSMGLIVWSSVLVLLLFLSGVANSFKTTGKPQAGA